MNTTLGTLAIPNDPTPWFTTQPNNSKEYCVLWLQGWRSTIQKHSAPLQRMAAQTGVTFTMLDYAGHGSHPTPMEETTRELQFSEALAAYDALEAEGYKNIIVAGTSFGGYLGALLSARRTPRALILRAPAIYMDAEFSLPRQECLSFLGEEYARFKETLSARSESAPLKAVRKFTNSIYVIEHELDEEVPRNITRAYFEVAKRANYLVIPATKHAVAKMPEPEKHYAYIEQAVAAIIGLVQQEDGLIK